MQKADLEIDLQHDTACVYLSVEIPKDAGDEFVAAALWTVSQAFAETEGAAADWMHELLERAVRGFEDDSLFKFTWARRFEKEDRGYPTRLRKNLMRVRRVWAE